MSALHIQRYNPDHEDEKKQLIIALHGGALSHRMYKDVVPILTAYGYTVVAPDLPGHGQSKTAGPFTFQKATECLYRIITDLRNEFSAITLVGVSLGGQVVLDILQNHPQSITSAIVSGASVAPEDEQARWEMPHMTDDEGWKKIIAEDVNQMGMDQAAGIQQESFSFQFTPPQSLPPVLVVIGEHDTAMARRDYKLLGQKLLAANHQSQMLVLDGAWHNHPIDVPERFAEVVHQWVTSLT